MSSFVKVLGLSISILLLPTSHAMKLSWAGFYRFCESKLAGLDAVNLAYLASENGPIGSRLDAFASPEFNDTTRALLAADPDLLELSEIRHSMSLLSPHLRSTEAKLVRQAQIAEEFVAVHGLEGRISGLSLMQKAYVIWMGTRTMPLLALDATQRKHFERLGLGLFDGLPRFDFEEFRGPSDYPEQMRQAAAGMGRAAERAELVRALIDGKRAEIERALFKRRLATARTEARVIDL